MAKFREPAGDAAAGQQASRSRAQTDSQEIAPAYASQLSHRAKPIGLHPERHAWDGMIAP
jgi:hypothetical protein